MRLYLALDDYAGSSGRAWPHQDTVAERIGASVRSVQLWLAELEAAGYVATRRTIRGNRYRLSWTVPEVDCGPAAATECGSNPEPVSSQEPVPSDRTEAIASETPPAGIAAAEREAVERGLQAFAPMGVREEDGRPWNVEETAAALVAVGMKLGLQPFAVAAFLFRLYNRVARKRSAWPETARWFRTCLDNEYSPDARVLLKRAPHSPPRSNPQPLAVGDQEFSRDLMSRAVASVRRMR